MNKTMKLTSAVVTDLTLRCGTDNNLAHVNIGGLLDREHDGSGDGFEAISHGMISNDAILSPSSLKKNRRSTGLPGKFPARWLVTTVFPSFSSHAIGSLVY